MKLQDLPRSLIGGTLVEYKDNCGFDLEYGRATITDMGMDLDGKTYFIKTDNEEAHMTQNVSPAVEAMGYTAEAQKQGEIYLLRSSMGWCYTLAPKGVEIPKRPNWLDVSIEEFGNSVREHISGQHD